VAGEFGDVVTPRLGEAAEAMDEHGGRAVSLLHVVDEKTVELTPRDLDLGHVRL